MFAGCSQCRIPAIDPTGQRIFLPSPNSTSFVAPNCGSSCFPQCHNPVFVPAPEPPVCPEPGPVYPASILPPTAVIAPPLAMSAPQAVPVTGDAVKLGELQLNQTNVIAPVGSEVVILSGLCGTDGYLVTRQPIDWLLSQESVGQFVDVSRYGHRLFGDREEKLSANYVTTRTATSQSRITRGTTITLDDVHVKKGQAWVVVSSPSEGTSFVTCLAPEAEIWDRRRKTAKINWIDAKWQFPAKAVASASSQHDLTTVVTRATSNEPVEGWIVQYEILPGSIPTEFFPTRGTKVETRTDANGVASVPIRLPAGSQGSGVSNIQVNIIRPSVRDGQKSRLSVASGSTTVNWSSADITVRVNGPKAVAKDSQFVYRIEVSNPGDIPTRDVMVSIDRFPREVLYVSANPAPTPFGSRLVWKLGDIQPKSDIKYIDVQLTGVLGGQAITPIRVESVPDQKSQTVDVQTEIAVPCLSLEVMGPTEGQVGSDLSYVFKISNVCNNNLTNIRLTDQFDYGLQVPGQTNPVRYGPFDLAFGQSREIPLTFRAIQAGTFCHNLTVTADGGHTASARACVNVLNVITPNVSVEIEGAESTEEGSSELFQIKVTNSGNTPLSNLKVAASSSEAFVTELATDSAERTDTGLQWTLEQLDEGETKVFEIKQRCVAPDMAALNEVSVTSDEGATSSIQRTTMIAPSAIAHADVERLPLPVSPSSRNEELVSDRQPTRRYDEGLAIAISQMDGAVRIGDRVTYLVTIENNRDAFDQNVKVKLQLPEGLAFVSQGLNDDLLVAETSTNGYEITFQPRREIRPREVLTVRAEFKATKTGSQPVKVIATSAQTSDTIERVSAAIVNH